MGEIALFGDDWDWFHDAKDLLKDGDLEGAEELYSTVSLVSVDDQHRASAINSMVYSILIPQQRFSEARIWLEDGLNLEVDYETWNSLENLGFCELSSGNTELAARYLLQVVQAQAGPAAEAQALLDKIRSGQLPKSVPTPNFNYSEEWIDLDVSVPLGPEISDREHYFRVIRHLNDSKKSFRLDLFETHQGPVVSGFVDEYLTQELTESGLSRDLAAQGCFDYIRFVLQQEQPSVDPMKKGIELLSQGEEFLGLKSLKVAARTGNPDAMLWIANEVAELHGIELASPWYRLAAANGNEEAALVLSSTLEAAKTAAYCTQCGYPRRPGAKFCVDCGYKYAS